MANRSAARGVRLAERVCSSPEFAGFDRELDILHVGEFPLQPRQRFAQLRSDRRKRQGERCLGFRRAAAGDDVFALGSK